MSTFMWYPGRHAAVSRAFADSLTAAARDVVSDVERRQVVPHAEEATKPGHTAGALASSVRVEPAISNRARIIWDAPFAARAYFHPDWDFSQAVHGGAEGRWMDDYMAGGNREDFARDAYRKHLRRSGALS